MYTVTVHSGGEADRMVMRDGGMRWLRPCLTPCHPTCSLSYTIYTVRSLRSIMVRTNHLTMSMSVSMCACGQVPHVPAKARRVQAHGPARRLHETEENEWGRIASHHKFALVKPLKSYYVNMESSIQPVSKMLQSITCIVRMNRSSRPWLAQAACI